MNSVQTFTGARKARPEEVLVNVEASLQVPLDQIARRIRVAPNVNFSGISALARIEAAVAENRHNLDCLPDLADVEKLATVAAQAVSVSSPQVIKRVVANLIGAYPNAAIANPEIYLSALVFDLMDRRISDAVAFATCRKIRRTSKFVPSIAEVLETAESLTDQWQAIINLPAELETTRAALVQALARGERTLALVQQEIAEGYRDDRGMIVRRKIYGGAA